MKHVVLYVGHLYKPFWTKKIWPGWQGGSGKVKIMHLCTFPIEITQMCHILTFPSLPFYISYLRKSWFSQSSWVDYGGPMIVSGYVSGGNIWWFPNVTLPGPGAQLKCSTIIGPPLVGHKKHKIHKKKHGNRPGAIQNLPGTMKTSGGTRALASARDFL